MKEFMKKYGFHFISKTTYMQRKLESNLVVKISFHSAMEVNADSHVKVLIIHKVHGQVDWQPFHFKSYNMTNKQTPTVELLEAVNHYVSMFTSGK